MAVAGATYAAESPMGGNSPAQHCITHRKAESGSDKVDTKPNDAGYLDHRHNDSGAAT